MNTTTSVERIPVLDLTPEISALGTEFLAAMERVMRSTNYIMGPDVREFEAEAAEFLGVRHAVSVNSGTDALVIALRALGVGPGDQVITTPFSFFATAESISSVGATPVFVDVDADTYNLDPSRIAERIGARTKAILPVHLFGRACNLAEIMDLAAKHDLLVIEDCAQSFGATYGGKRTGTFGHAGAFSFFPSKNLGAFGDAGLITTDLDEVAESARMLRAHGAKKKYQNEMIGYNSRMDTLQAAILRVKLPHVDEWNRRRRQVARVYDELLHDVQAVVRPTVTDDHVFHQYTIRILEGDRDAVRDELRTHGVETMVYYPVPQDQLSVYRGRHPRNPVSDELARQVLSLPIWPSLERAVQERIVAALKAALS